MVTSIARQSVILKCTMQASVLLGNYEFYYGAGLFCKLQKIFDDGHAAKTSDGRFLAEEEIRPLALQEFLMPRLKEAVGADEKETYLIKILKGCKVTEEYDEQMRELFLWGLEEEQMWQMTI